MFMKTVFEATLELVLPLKINKSIKIRVIKSCMKLYMTVIQQYKIGKYNSQITLPLVPREPFSFTYFPVFLIIIVIIIIMGSSCFNFISL